MDEMQAVKTNFGTVYTNRRDEMSDLIMAISKAIHLRLKNDIAKMEPKNAMENLQRSLYNK